MSHLGKMLVSKGLMYSEGWSQSHEKIQNFSCIPLKLFPKENHFKLTESEFEFKGGGVLRRKALFNCYIFSLHITSM